jgi:hypothetical protein
MNIITNLDYEILKRIPVFPEEASRGDIVRSIKEAYPDDGDKKGKYANLTTAVFDAVLLKYTYMFPLIEDKLVPNHAFFVTMYDDAECLQSTLEELPLEWIKKSIGKPIDIEGSEYKELFGRTNRTRNSTWYKTSDFRLS